MTTKGKSKSLVVTMDTPQRKKNVTRFDSPETKPAMNNAYINNEALASIGNPERIKVTIEADD